jgi:topoisomerase IA-like protein
MSEKRKVLIIGDSTIAAGRFVDRGDVIEVPPQVAQDLINERKATANEKAVAAREAELAAAKAKTEKAAAKPKSEKAAAPAE